MHRLRNAFVEIERDRREAARQAMLSRFPEIAEAEARIVVIDEEIERLRHAERLRSIRDREFDAARAALLQWLSVTGAVPEWLREETATLDQWRSASRLARLVIHWRTDRFDGDQEIYERLEAWRA